MSAWTVPAVGRHTSGYGPRNTGIPGASTFHRGYDIAPPVPGQRGVTVHTVGPGRVAAVDYNSGRGRFVRVRHDDGSLTLYQHLDRVDVQVGKRVATGQRLGLMGDSGIGAGVHLHFECYEAGVNTHVLANAIDPVGYMARRGVNLGAARLAADGTPLPSSVLTIRPTSPPNPITPRSWYDMASKADLRAVVDEALAAREGPVPLYRIRGTHAAYRMVDGVAREWVTADKLPARRRFVDLPPWAPFWALPVVGRIGELVRRPGTAAAYAIEGGPSGTPRLRHIDRATYEAWGRPTITDRPGTDPVWDLEGDHR